MSLETFVSLCGALDTDAGELLWGEVKYCPKAALDMWKPSERSRDDAYTMYVKIMKSVAEIMNEA